MPRTSWERKVQIDGSTKYVYFREYFKYEGGHEYPGHEEEWGSRPIIKEYDFGVGVVSDRFSENEPHPKPLHVHYTASAMADLPLTPKNSDLTARRRQAEAFEKEGFDGPVGPGEARALSNMMREMGKDGFVRRGFINVTRTVNRPPTRYQVRWARLNGQPVPSKRASRVTMLQYCYVFKSPIPEIPFEKFVRLARLYKGDKGGIRAAVRKVLADPSAMDTVETLDALDVLGALGGVDNG